MRLKITHQTHYRYDSSPHYGLQQLRLTPKSRAGQSVASWETQVDGGRAELAFDDQHNNHVILVSFEAGRREISVTCSGEVETADRAGVVGSHGGYTPLWLFERETSLTQPGPHLRKLIKDLGKAGSRVEGEAREGGGIERLHSLSALIAERVRYETGKTHSETTIEDALEAGHGVCQDHAHIFVSAARLLGHPARYVSGYLMLLDRVEQDASHAWPRRMSTVSAGSASIRQTAFVPTSATYE